MKKLIAVVGMVVVLGAGAFAASTVLPAGAQTDPSTQSDPSAPVAPGGHRGEKIKGVLDGLVADGTITQEQETKILDVLAAAAPQGGKGGRFGGHRPEILKKAVETSAGALGMSVDDLKAELKSGKTIADVATEKGVPLEDVTKALTDAATAAIGQAVTDGKVTQEQADKLTARLPEAIQRFETTVPRAHGHGPMGGPDDSGSSDSSSSSTSS